MKTACLQLIFYACMVTKFIHAYTFGGWREMSPANPKLKEVAEIGLEKWQTSEDIFLKVDKVISGRYQVVKGTIYRVVFTAIHPYLPVDATGVYKCVTEVYIPPSSHKMPDVHDASCRLQTSDKWG